MTSPSSSLKSKKGKVNLDSGLSLNSYLCFIVIWRKMMKYVKAASIVGSNWRTCAGNGDYATLQRENGMEFCADKEDGWQVR